MIHQAGVNWFYSCLKTLLDFFFSLFFALSLSICLKCLILISGKRSSMLKLWLTPLAKFH